MYKKGIYKILTNEPLTDAVWRMKIGRASCRERV